jgi:hypothetical protein
VFAHGVTDNEDSDSDVIVEVVISVVNGSEAYPTTETDVRYELVVPTNGTVTIRAQTVYGALHGLQVGFRSVWHLLPCLQPQPQTQPQL